MPHTNARRTYTRRPSPLLTFLGLTGLLTLTAGFLNFVQPAAHAATTFTVNSTGDGADSNPADNLCNDGAGHCTLRAAMQQANATAGADTINFSVTGTINLTGALPDILDSLTIDGPGSSLLTVRRDTGGDYRIFFINQGETPIILFVNINGLTVANGRTQDGFAHGFGGGGGAGGGVVNAGTLTMTDVTLTGNRTGTGGSLGAATVYGGPGGPGGAVYNVGTLTMTNVMLTGNSTGGGGEGFTAGEGGDGGAIFNVVGTLTMNNCVVRGNSTGGGGPSNTSGGSNNSGGRGGDGGGIYTTSGRLTMNNCIVSENTTGAGGNSSGMGGTGGRGGHGAGIYAREGTTLTTLNVSNNTAGRGGGAPLGTAGGVGQGGGIYFETGSSILSSSTVSGNTGGSAIHGRGDMSMTNTTVSGNRLNGTGGGAVNTDGSFLFFPTTLTNCTITANEGPGLIAVGPPFVSNNIIAGNGGGIGPDVSGSFKSLGHNLVGDVGAASGFTIVGDQVGTSGAPLNARLGPLADNGGRTLTHALLAGSPALDAGSNALALDKDNNPLTTDQRGTGFPRRTDAADADTTQTVDIGAFEAHPSVEDVADKATSPNVPISFAFNVGDAALGISSVTAASSNQTLLPNANITLSGAGSTRTLQLTPAAGATGSANVTLIVNGSNGRSVSDTFVLGISRVNAAPTFTKGADQTVNEDSGPQTINGWATGITPGPPDDAGQSLSFVVTANTNPGLFSSAPSVSPGGTLTFTPAPDANGSAAVTLVLKDGGGTADGGQDTSAPQTFNINVTAVNDAPVNSLPAAQTTGRQTPLVFSGPNGVSVADRDAGTGSVRLTLLASSGTLTLGGTAGLTFVSGDGTGDREMSFTGTLANVNAALNGLTFMPSHGATGEDSIHFITDDQGNTGSGGARTDTDILRVSVVNVPGGTLELFAPDEAPEGSEVTVRVGRSFGSDGATSIDYATTGGTAVGGATCGAGVDYVSANGTFSWAGGDSFDKIFRVTLCNDFSHGADKTFRVILSNLKGSATLGTPSKTITIRDDDPSGNRIQFDQLVYTAAEGAGSLTVTVRRAGSTAISSGVDYATEETGSTTFVRPCSQAIGLALDRCDFTKAAGRLVFAAGETVKTFQVLLSDDSYAEGTEVAFVRLRNADGGFVVGPLETATLEITDDASEPFTNPIGDSGKFVRQHYHDFLAREPDASGLQFWTNEIEQCGADAVCREVKRINVSAAFFLSIEFQQTGYLVERMYKTAYGDFTPGGFPAPQEGPVPIVRFEELLPDTQRLGREVIVGQEGWEQRLEENKQAYALEFVRRPRFASAYPSTLTADEFVARLDRNTGGVFTAADKATLVAALGADPSDDSRRARVVRAAAENEAFSRAEFNRAFVLMQYFGYLRRNPSDAPEQGLNFAGYNFWLSKLDEFNGNFVRAEMVKAFITSDEYRQRFGL